LASELSIGTYNLNWLGVVNYRGTTLSHRGIQPTVATEKREPGTTQRDQSNPF